MGHAFSGSEAESAWQASAARQCCPLHLTLNGGVSLEVLMATVATVLIVMMLCQYRPGCSAILVSAQVCRLFGAGL